MTKAPVYKALLSNIGRCFVVIFMFFVPKLVSAQERGFVKVNKDPRIDTLMARRATIKVGGAKATGGGTGYSSWGYRVQIYNGSTRRDAYDAQERFHRLHPEMRTYISYAEPNFKVHAGDLRTRLEAEKLMQELRVKFTGLFIISGKINPPKTEITND